LSHRNNRETALEYASALNARSDVTTRRKAQWIQWLTGHRRARRKALATLVGAARTQGQQKPMAKITLRARGSCASHVVMGQPV
jgi:hypothetical protein